MMLDYQTLRALSAVIRTGSFDKAAHQLGVTASAISQRIKGLEDRLGTVLVVRGQPCEPTDVGRRLIQHADDVALLEHAVARDLGYAAASETVGTTIRVAANADSLATWFVTALAAAGDPVLYDVVIDDQDHSLDWLARGEVVAAISGQDQAIQGCDCRPLGALRYIPTASPAFVARLFADGLSVEAFKRAPSMTFNGKDQLQHDWVKGQTGQSVVMPTHWLPSTQAFVDAAKVGLGWGMNPEVLVREALASGQLVALMPDQPYDVPLYWHTSRLASQALKPLTEAVTQVAASMLAPISG